MQNLVVIADRKGCKNSALHRAVELQQQTGAKITLLGFCYADIHSIDDPALAKLSRSKLEKSILNSRQLELEELCKQLKLSSTEITIKPVWSKHMAEAITTYCKDHLTDLLIKSANRSSTLIYTSTDWQLLRTCPAPVMLTSRKSWKKKARILAAVDFATKTKSKIKLNQVIVEQALALGKALDHEVHFAYSISVPRILVDMDLINPRKYIHEKKVKLQPAINAFYLKYGIDSSQLHIKAGDPEKIIPSIASKLKTDVVIVGTVGRKGIKGALLGNTAEGILGRLHTDIIALKP